MRDISGPPFCCKQVSLISDRFIAPLEGVVLIVWWIVDTIRTDPSWWQLSTESLAMTLSQVISHLSSICVVVGMITSSFVKRHQPHVLSKDTNPMLEDDLPVVGRSSAGYDWSELVAPPTHHLPSLQPPPQEVCDLPLLP